MAETVEKKKKKRRRAEEETPKEPKKQKVSGPPPSFATAKSFRITAVTNLKGTPPVLAMAPGLSLSPSTQFDSYTRPGKTKRRGTPAMKEIMLHSSSHPTLDYTGTEERLADNKPALRHYLGIFDPVTGEMQLIETPKVTIRGTVRARQADTEASAHTAAKKTNAESRATLGETFGTRKAKKALHDLAENAIRRSGGADLDAGELALMKSLKETTADMATAEELQAAIDQAKPVPKGHYDAEEVDEVYIPEEIIGQEILSAIPVLDWQKDVKAGNDIQLFSRFVANRLRRVAAHPEAVQRLRILRYLLWLIGFWHAARPGRDKGTRKLPSGKVWKAPLQPAPDIVLEDIRLKFSDHGIIRKFHTDLLMTHCCVFASIIDNFDVNMLDLREDLKLEQKEMGQYFKEIGAHVKEQKVENRKDYFGKLMLPLKFPETRQRQRKRR